MTAKSIDNSAGKKIGLPDDLGGSDEGGNPTRVNTNHLDGLLIRELAKKVGGQTWDGESSSWK